jgi:type IV secretion system protein VirB5
MAGSNWTLPRTRDTPLEIFQRHISNQRRRDMQWRIFAIASFVMLIVALAVAIWAVRLPKSVPCVITVSDFGEANYVGPVTKLSYSGLKVPQVAIDYQMTQFVTKRFSVPADGAVLRQNLTDAYRMLTDITAAKLTEELSSGDDPRKRFGRELVTVEVQTILKLSENSYQLDFFLTDTSLGGRLNWRDHMRGVLTVAMLEPDADQQKSNPLGIFFSGFDFTLVERLNSVPSGRGS